MGPKVTIKVDAEVVTAAEMAIMKALGVSDVSQTRLFVERLSELGFMIMAKGARNDIKPTNASYSDS
jgi:hypothetical protein